MCMVLSPDKKQISYLKIAGYFITDTPNLLLVYSVDSEFEKFEGQSIGIPYRPRVFVFF